MAEPMLGSSGSAHRIRQLTQSHAPGIWDYDAGSGRLSVTPRLREILGFGERQPISLQDIVQVTHPDDRDWFEALGSPGTKEHDGTASFRFRIRKENTQELRWISCTLVFHSPVASHRNIPGHCGLAHDITDQFETSQALMVSEERLRLAIEAGKMAVWEVDLETGAMTPSAELNLLCGFPPDAEPTLWDIRALYNPGELERLAVEGATVESVRQRAVGGAFEPWSEGAFKSGADRTQVQAEVGITTPAGIPKHLMLRAQYALSPAGRPRLTGLLVDITETKNAQEQLAVVAREMQHRVKNSLAVVGAIAIQSLRGRADPDAALEQFLARLHALSSATDLILKRHSSEVELSDLVKVIIKPYRGRQNSPFAISGSIVTLPAKFATPLGMVLHELCTNAVKYGSLSVSSGKVEISWAHTAGSDIVLVWQEKGGPPVSAPSKRGFGTKLLDQLIAAEIGGSLKADYDPEGLRCEIRFSATALR